MVNKAASTTVDQTASEDTRPPSRFNNNDLNNITSFGDAVRIAEATLGHTVTEIDGFRIGTDADKQALVGSEMLIMEWDFVDGDHGKEYVVMRVIAQVQSFGKLRLRKLVLNDSGVGITPELRAYTTQTGRQGGLHIVNGLRVSTYAIDPATRKPLNKAEQADIRRSGRYAEMASTYYLDLPKNDTVTEEPSY